MRKSFLVLVSAVALGTFAASGANAMPIGSVTPTASGVDQVASWLAGNAIISMVGPIM